MKFKDCRADRHADHRRRRSRAGRRHRRGQGPALRRAPRGGRRRRRASARSLPRRDSAGREPAGRGGHLRLGRHADAVAPGRPARAVARLRARGARPPGRGPRRCRPRTSPRPTAGRRASTRPRRRPGGAAATSTRRRLDRRSSPTPGSTPSTTATSSRSRPTAVLGAAHPHRPAGRARCGKGCTTGESRSACCRTRSGPATTTASVFERDGVLDLLDADVYSSARSHLVKPHPEAFLAVCRELGVEPRRGRLRRRPRVRGRARAAAGGHARDLGAALATSPLSQRVARDADARRRAAPAARRARHRRRLVRGGLSRS